MTTYNHSGHGDVKDGPAVLYDHQAFQMQRFGGISRYFCEIIRRLDLNYDIAVQFSKNYYLNEWSLGSHRVPMFRFMYNQLRQYCSRRNTRFATKCLQSQRYDIFHPTYYDSYFLEYLEGLPYVITVHDMIHEKFPEMFSDAETVIREKRETILQADRIIAVSENTKKDIIDLLNVSPEKIDVIYHATSMKPHAGPNRLKLPEKYLLYVGDRSAYKNFDRMVYTVAQLRADFPDLYLVCTGRALKSREYAIIDKAGLHDRVLTIKASDAGLRELYSRAVCFVYPSLYEGFGIPILEAYACRCPVVLSQASCFPEIAGEAGCYFDPLSTSSMTASIRSMLEQSDKREALRRAGTERLKLFSWERSVKATEATYRKVRENTRGRSR